MISQEYNVAASTIMQQAQAAFELFSQVNPLQRADFLDQIAIEIEALGESLIQTTMGETNLPMARLVGERGRTTMQLRMFASMLREGNWVEASIDHANPEKVPAKPDIRKMLVPMGPVVVFGASNFPYAYSTAGGDTASALAAGCSVVVKAHPAHVKTSAMVAAAIAAAIEKTGMPANCFQHILAEGFEMGTALVQDPSTAAVGFTGSYTGGKALFDAAASRPQPIPVFAEMGSTNPVLLLPESLSLNAAGIAQQYAGSITLGVGQFCTNPGIILGIASPALDLFIETLATETAKIAPAKMLHGGILKAWHHKRKDALGQTGVKAFDHHQTENTAEAFPAIATVSGAAFISNAILKEEVFGPYSLVVICEDVTELKEAWKSIKGQLTTTLMGNDADFAAHPELIQIATGIAGRVLFNGVPTGVDVCAGMVHGGPFPASTDSRFTAVGINAVKRWIRPVCFQNCPDHLLPLALQEANPLGLKRMVDGNWYA